MLNMMDIYGEGVLLVSNVVPVLPSKAWGGVTHSNEELVSGDVGKAYLIRKMLFQGWGRTFETLPKPVT